MVKAGYSLRSVVSLLVALAGVIAVVAWSGLTSGAREPNWQFRVSTGDYAARADLTIRLLERKFYNGTGLWHMCTGLLCSTKNLDWGSDSLTYVLWFRLSRPGARYQDCSWPVSPGRSPNPACPLLGTGLSTVSAVRRG